MKQILLISLTSCLFSGLHAQEDEKQSSLPPELARTMSNYKRGRADSITAANRNQIKALLSLKVSYTKKGDLTSANLTQAEIDQLEAEIGVLAADGTVPIGGREEKGALYVDAVERSAGYHGECIYKFDIATTSGKAIVTVESNIPLKSQGEVFLKSERDVTLIGTWDSTKAKGWPLTFPVKLSKPGKYEVHFRYKSGGDGMNVKSVKVDTRRAGV